MRSREAVLPVEEEVVDETVFFEGVERGGCKDRGVEAVERGGGFGGVGRGRGEVRDVEEEVVDEERGVEGGAVLADAGDAGFGVRVFGFGGEGEAEGGGEGGGGVGGRGVHFGAVGGGWW